MAKYTIEIPHDLNKVLYTVEYRTEGRELPCEECLGEGKATIVMANGEKWLMLCPGCDGKKVVKQDEAAYVPVTQAFVRVEQQSGGGITYITAQNEHIDSGKIFASKEEAEAAAAGMTEHLDDQEKKRRVWRTCRQREERRYTLKYYYNQRRRLLKDLESLEAYIAEYQQCTRLEKSDSYASKKGEL